MKGFLNTFTDTLWKIVSVVIIVGVFLLVAWFIYKRDKKAGERLREATGKITNPAEDTDKTRSERLREALGVIWE